IARWLQSKYSAHPAPVSPSTPAMVQMGTLSKAFASLGGYVAGSAELIDFLRNRAASWIYTTGLSPADTAAALGAIALLNQESHRLTQLHQNTRYLKQRVDQLLLALPKSQKDSLKRLTSDSAIVCVQVKDAATVLHLSEQLKKQGVFVSAVRPPTVPVSRLRMSVMATHNTSHLDQCVVALRRALVSFDLPLSVDAISDAIPQA
ncbi:MAG: aminotransferase class I/II-fold pyridoxal phosphate-dependent enzyme, partial [Cyanobacteria bacterium J06576_12]